jgi:hypothetical protein
MATHSTSGKPRDSLGTESATLHTVSNRRCARILLSVLQTLLHGAFVWLQPRSPVVAVVVESGRDPDPPVARVVDAAAAAGSGRPVAPAVRANLRGAAENRRAEAGSRLRAERAVHANHRLVVRAAVHPAAREAGARAAAHGRAEVAKREAAVAVLVAEHSLQSRA